MGRTLSQQEIDAIVKARRAKDSDAAPQKAVRAWDFRAAGQLANDKARTITALHENFARNLTSSVGAYLRVPFEVTLLSVEQLPYREFLERLQELTFLTSFSVQPQDVYAAMQIDHSIVFALIDVLLGGNGEADQVLREITEIEEDIIDVVARIICRELQSAWQPFGVEMEMGERQFITQMQHFLQPTEKALVLTFDIQMSQIRGALNLLFPASVSKVMARELTKDWAYRNKDKSSVQRMREKLLKCAFNIDLGVPNLKVSTRELLKVKAGDVLRLQVPAKNSAALILGHRSVFDAAPVRIDNRRAAQLGDRRPDTSEQIRTK